MNEKEMFEKEMLAAAEICSWKHLSGVSTVKAIKKRYAKMKALYCQSLHDKHLRRRIITIGCISYPMGLVFDIIYLLSEVERLETQQQTTVISQWISVKDQIPNTAGVFVLVLTSDEVVHIMRTALEVKELGGGAYDYVQIWVNGSGKGKIRYSTEEVTHWCPLPEMPE